MDEWDFAKIRRYILGQVEAEKQKNLKETGQEFPDYRPGQFSAPGDGMDGTLSLP